MINDINNSLNLKETCCWHRTIDDSLLMINEWLVAVIISSVVDGSS